MKKELEIINIVYFYYSLYLQICRISKVLREYSIEIWQKHILPSTFNLIEKSLEEISSNIFVQVKY